MKCEKCGGEWIPPKTISVSLTNCPFCNAPLLNTETASSYTDMGDFLRYLVSLYDADLYGNRQKLNNLVSDLYRGDDRMKRAYRRAILDDALPQRIYALSLKPLNEREAFRNQIVAQFSEANFYSLEFGKQVVDSFVKGLGVEIVPPISTKATEEDGEWIDEYGVTYSADRRKLICGNGDLKTYNVKEGTVVICDRAFYMCENLTNLMLSNSVTHIGDNALYGCENLTNINIPNSVLQIGNVALARIPYLTVESGGNFVLENNLLFPKDKKTIIWCSFENKVVCIPNSVTQIGNQAFYGCENLTSVNIPNSVTRIGYAAFAMCKNLTNMNIPNSVTQIGYGAFAGIQHITVESGGNFVLENNLLFPKDKKTIIWCSFENKEVCIPNSVTQIRGHAFNGCENLISINLPNSITQIGSYAFYGCKNLINITIPNSVTQIGSHVFNGCENLISINLPNSITQIGSYAFYGCKNLINITIPNSVTLIESGMFANCKNLTSINLPNTVTQIGNVAFAGCNNLTSITLLNSVTHIGDNTFVGCTNLISITLPNSVTHIGDSAFSYCTNLTRITLPNSVTQIGNGVFLSCRNLTTIAIPPGTTEKFKSLLKKEYHRFLKETV